MRFKLWFCERFLPAYVSDICADEIKRLIDENAALRKEKELLKALIAGMERGLRLARRTWDGRVKHNAKPE